MKSFGNRKPIQCEEANGLIKKFNSISEASKHYKLTLQTISKNLRGLINSPKGKFTYQTIDNEEYEILEVYPFDDQWKVSNFGRIITPTGKLSKCKSTVNSYKRIRTKNGSVSVHRMVATCFCENPLDKPFVNHIDGNKLNNNASNLEWVTHSENMRHAEILHTCEGN
jgi:hypothetical protein